MEELNASDSNEVKTVYVVMSADILHNGHINVISTARKYGRVILGLLTDSAIASYKRLPLLSYNERKKIVENIKGIYKVVPQETLDYVPNLKKYKPDYVVHGDDWKVGIQKKVREEVIQILSEWNGKLIEVSYTKGVSSTYLINKIRRIGVTPQYRLRQLRRLLKYRKIVRVIETHNGLCGLLLEHTKVTQNDKLKEFDAAWISSLTDSVAKGKPDIGYVDFSSRLNTIHQILETTTKPIIFDGDSGGLTEHFVFMVRTLERVGVSAVVIEDKIGLKKNSLFGTSVKQVQDSIENFSRKIHEGKKAQVTEDFMIIARIESLILKKGLNDALERAKAYINAGADGILIHSKSTSPSEIKEFLVKYKETGLTAPVFVVPTTYNTITDTELSDLGVNLVIHANHLLRAAYPAMKHVAELILEKDCSHEADKMCMGISEILTLVPGGK